MYIVLEKVSSDYRITVIKSTRLQRLWTFHFEPSHVVTIVQHNPGCEYRYCGPPFQAVSLMMCATSNLLHNLNVANSHETNADDADNILGSPKFCLFIIDASMTSIRYIAQRQVLLFMIETSDHLH